MIYTIKLICDEVEGFSREIAIDSDATFLDLNRAILDSCGYADDQITSFYICDEDWRQGTQITREDMGVESSETDIYLMEKTPLSDLIEDEGQHLEYVFDPFSNRLFFMSVVDASPGKHLKAPKLLSSSGKAPGQIADMDLPAVPKAGKASDGFSDEDAYDIEGFAYNDDELDMEGFEITDGSNF